MDEENSFVSSDTDGNMKLSKQQTGTIVDIKKEDVFDNKSDESDTEISSGKSTPVFLPDEQYLSNTINRNSLDSEIIRYSSSSIKTRNIYRDDDNEIHAQGKHMNDNSFIREASISENSQGKSSAHESDTEHSKYDTTTIGRSTGTSYPSQTSFLDTEKSKTKILQEDDSDSAIDILYSIRTLFEEQNHEDHDEGKSADDSFVSDSNCCACCCCCFCCFPSFCSCKSKAVRSERNNVTIVKPKSSGAMSVADASTSSYMDKYSLKTEATNEVHHSKDTETQNVGHEQNIQDTAFEDKMSDVSVNVSNGEYPSQISILNKGKSKSAILKHDNVSGTDVLQNNSAESEPQDQVQDDKETNDIVSEAAIADEKCCTCCFCFFPSLCSCKSKAVGIEQGSIAQSTNENLERKTLAVAGTSVTNGECTHKAVTVTEDKNIENGIKQQIQEKNAGVTFPKDNKAGKSKDDKSKSVTSISKTSEKGNTKSSAFMDKGQVRSDNQSGEGIDNVTLVTPYSDGESSKKTEHMHTEGNTANKERMTKNDDEIVDLQDIDNVTNKQTSCFCFFRARPVKSVSVKSLHGNVENVDNSPNVVQSVNNEKDTNKSTAHVKEQYDQNNINKMPIPNSTTTLASQSQNDCGNLYETPMQESNLIVGGPAKQKNIKDQFSPIKNDSADKTLNKANMPVFERDNKETKENEHQHRESSTDEKHLHSTEAVAKERASTEKGNVNALNQIPASDNNRVPSKLSVSVKEKLNEDTAKGNSIDNKVDTEGNTANEERMTKNDDEIVDLQDVDNMTNKQTSCFCFFRARPVKSVSVKSLHGNVENVDNSPNVVQSVNNAKDTNKSTAHVKEQYDQNNIKKMPIPNSSTTMASQSQNDCGNLNEPPMQESNLIVAGPAKQKNIKDQFSPIKNDSAEKTLNKANMPVSERDNKETKENEHQHRESSTDEKHLHTTEAVDKERASAEKGNVNALNPIPASDNNRVPSKFSVLEKEKLNEDTAKGNSIDNKVDIATANNSSKTTDKRMFNENVSYLKKRSISNVPIDLQNSGNVERSSCFCFLGARPSLNSAAVGSDKCILDTDGSQNSKQKSEISTSVFDYKTSNKAKAVNTEQIHDNCNSEKASDETDVQNVSKIRSGRKEQSRNLQQLCLGNEKQTSIYSEQNEPDANKLGKTNSEMSAVDKQKGNEYDTKGHSFVDNSSVNSASKDKTNKQELTDMDRKSSNSEVIVGIENRDASNAGNTTKSGGNSSNITFGGKEMTHIDYEKKADSVKAIDERKQSRDDKRTSRALVSNKNTTVKTNNIGLQSASTEKGKVSPFGAFSVSSLESTSDQRNENKTLDESQCTPTNVLLNSNNRAETIDGSTNANRNDNNVDTDDRNITSNRKTVEEDRASITTNENKSFSSFETTSIHMEQAIFNKNTGQSENNVTLHSANTCIESDPTIFDDGHLETKTVLNINPIDKDKTTTLPLGQTNGQEQVSMLDRDGTTVTVANAQEQNLNTNQKSSSLISVPVNISTYTEPTKQTQIDTTQVDIGANAESNSHTQIQSKHDFKATSDISQSNKTDIEQHSTVKQPRTVDASWGSFANDDVTPAGETTEGHLSQQNKQNRIPYKSDNVQQETITGGKEQSKLTADNKFSKCSGNASSMVESFQNLTNVMPGVGAPAANNVVPTPTVSFPAKQQNLANESLSASTKNALNSNASNISGHNRGAAKTGITTRGLTAIDDNINDTINNKAKTIQSGKDSKTVTENKVNKIPAKPLGHSGDKIVNNRMSTSKLKSPGTVDTKVEASANQNLDTNKEMQRSSVKTKEAATSVLNKSKLGDKKKATQDTSNNQTRSAFQVLGADFNESCQPTVSKTTIHATKTSTKSEKQVRDDENKQFSKELGEAIAPKGAGQNLNKAKAEKPAATVGKIGLMTITKQELNKNEQVNETLSKATFNSNNETQKTHSSNNQDKHKTIAISRFNKGHIAAKTETTKESENHKNEAKSPFIQGVPLANKATDTTLKYSTLRKTKREKPEIDDYVNTESSKNETNNVSVANALEPNKGTSVDKPCVLATKQNVRDLRQGRNGQGVDIISPRKQTIETPVKSKLGGQTNIDKDIGLSMIAANRLAKPGISGYSKGKEIERQEHLNSSYKTKENLVKDSKLQNKSNIANAIRSDALSKKDIAPSTNGSDINKTNIHLPAVQGTPESNLVRPQVGVSKNAIVSKSSNTVTDKNLDAKKANNRPTNNDLYTNTKTVAKKQMTGNKAEQTVADQEKDKVVLSKEQLNTDTEKTKPLNLSVANNSTAVKATSKGKTTDKLNASKMPENKRTQIKDRPALDTQKVNKGPVTETPINNVNSQNINNKDQNSSRIREQLRQNSIKTIDPRVSGRLQINTKENIKGYSDSETHNQIVAKRTVISKQAQPENANFINGKISKGKVHLESSADARKPVSEYNRMQHQTNALTATNNTGHSNQKISVSEIHKFSNTTQAPSNTGRGIVTVKPSIPIKTQVGKSRLSGGKEMNVIESQKSKASEQTKYASTNYGDKESVYNKTTINTSAKGEIVTQKLPIEEKKKPTLSKTRRNTNNQTEKASMANAEVKTNKVNSTTAIKKDETMHPSSNYRGSESKTNRIDVPPAHNVNNAQEIEMSKHVFTKQKVSSKHHKPEKIIPTQKHSTEVVNRTAPTRQTINKQKIQTQRSSDADPKVMANKNSVALFPVRETGDFIVNKLSKGKIHDLDSSANTELQINKGFTSLHRINAVTEKSAGVGTTGPTKIKSHAQNANDHWPAVKHNTPVRRQDLQKTATDSRGKKITTSYHTSNVNNKASVASKTNQTQARHGDTYETDNKTAIHRPTTGKPVKQNQPDIEKNKLPLSKVNPDTNKVTVKVALANNLVKSDNGIIGSNTLSKARNLTDTSVDKGTGNNAIRVNVRPTQGVKLTTDTKSFDNKPNGSLQKESRNFKEHVGRNKKDPVSNLKAMPDNQGIHDREVMQSNRSIIVNSSNNKNAIKSTTAGGDIFGDRKIRKTGVPTMNNVSQTSRETNIFADANIQNRDTEIPVVGKHRMSNKTSFANINETEGSPNAFNIQSVDETQNTHKGRPDAKPFNFVPMRTAGNLKQERAEQKGPVQHYSYNNINATVPRRPVRQTHTKVPI